MPMKRMMGRGEGGGTRGEDGRGLADPDPDALAVIGDTVDTSTGLRREVVPLPRSLKSYSNPSVS